jgi:hypothetical protein
MNALYVGILKRAFRAAVAAGVPALIQYVTNSTNPWIMAATPALMAIGKYLRDKFNLPYIPV